MKSTNYSEKVLDHFKNPRNVGTLDGENTASGRVGNPVCGDIMEMYIDVDKEERIRDVKFQTFGCGSAVATSSMITEMAKGMKLDDAMNITRKDVADELEGLPPVKMHCSNLAADALHEAIKNYRRKREIEHVSKSAESEQSEQQETDAIVQGQSTAIKGEINFLGNGVYYSVEDPSKFANSRVLVSYRGEKSVELAIELTKVTGRVILLTEDHIVPVQTESLKLRLKRSDVKILAESQLLEILGEDGVEKVKIRDLDEDHKYELFVDDVIILEHVEIPNSCELPDNE